MIKSGAGFPIVLRFVGKMNVYEHQSLSMGWKIDCDLFYRISLRRLFFYISLECVIPDSLAWGTRYWCSCSH